MPAPGVSLRECVHARAALHAAIEIDRERASVDVEPLGADFSLEITEKALKILSHRLTRAEMNRR